MTLSVASRWSLVAGFLLFLLATSHQSPATASVKQEVYVTAQVHSFGGYTFTEALQLDTSKPGEQEVGKIVVEGLYNGEYPWIMRIYTDNLHFSGVGGAIRRQAAGGLVSSDGRFVIPLQVNVPNFGPDVWRVIPDINQAGTIPYQPAASVKELPSYTDCVLIGIDPRNALWVAGPDGILFTDDDNPLGDTTVKTPFEIQIKAVVSAAAAPGKYDAILYIETVPAP